MSAESILIQKERRFNDAVQLKVPDRIPSGFLYTFYNAKQYGITCEEAMYDYDKLAEVTRKGVQDTDPDAFISPFGIISIGRLLERLGDTRFMWPGHGVSPDSTYQFVENEAMSPDEYDDFLFDPTDYMLRVHLPKVMTALAPLQKLAYLPGNFYFLIDAMWTAPFGLPDVAKAVETLVETGRESLKMLARGGQFAQEMREQGYPAMVGGMTQAPFDYFADFLRGTRGALLDMFQRPDKLKAGMEKVTPMLIRLALDGVKASGTRRVFIPLHKGVDGFMSLDQFKEFFWPGLKEIILALIENDITPVILWEGNCTSRLETIADIPAGKALYWFEHTDMEKAKAALRDRVCMMGFMPSSILCMGTTDEVKAYCQKIIDVAAKDGGYILNGDVGIPDEAKPENVKAMVDYIREHGTY